MDNQPLQIHHRPSYNEMSTNQSMLHHISAQPTSSEQHNYHPMDVQNYQHQQKYRQNILVKNHFYSPKNKSFRRRARSECLSPSTSPKNYSNHHHYHSQNQNSSNCHDRLNMFKNGIDSKDHQRDHRRLQHLEEPAYSYQDYHQRLQVNETYKHRFHNLQIDGKKVQYGKMETPQHEELNGSYNSAYDQRRRLRASSESATHDYYFRETYPEDIDDGRAKRTVEMNSPTKERRSHHVINPRNSFSVLVNNTTHYRYSPKSSARSHYVGHKVGVVRVSSPLHKARMQTWKNHSGSISNSIPSIESSSTPETPLVDDYEEDEDDDDDPPMVYAAGDNIVDDDLTDPEDNYESSLSVTSSECSGSMPAPTVNTDSVQGGRVLSAPFAPSLFPFVPPFITFATFEEKGPDIPAIIHKNLKWKLTTITPLLVRKVLLNTGFRLMKSELKF